MTRFRKILNIIGGITLSVPVILIVGWMLWPKQPSKIIDFQPTAFEAKAKTEFFYSIGNELKYSSQIDPKSPTIFNGKIREVLVSPDNNKAAIIADNVMVIVSANGKLKQQVTPVGSIYQEPKPIGNSFVRDDDFQWSSDSRSIYLIKDEYYKSTGSQHRSEKSELWKYEIDANKFYTVLAPFRANHFFFSSDEKIYFHVADGAGNLHLRCFDGNHQQDLATLDYKGIPNNQLSSIGIESPFYTFSLFNYCTDILPKIGVKLKINKDKQQELLINDKVLLALSIGQGFKGPYYGSDMRGSTFLPGNKYFLFNVNSGNYSGQLLIDTISGSYMALPKDTQVYPLINTNTYQDFRVTNFGIEP